MIRVGQQIFITVNCPACSKPMDHNAPRESAFYVCSCHQEGCENRDVGLIIEKATGIVLWISTFFDYKGDGVYEALFPMLADKDGAQKWPKKP